MIETETENIASATTTKVIILTVQVVLHAMIAVALVDNIHLGIRDMMKVTNVGKTIGHIDTVIGSAVLTRNTDGIMTIKSRGEIEILADIETSGTTAHSIHPIHLDMTVIVTTTATLVEVDGIIKTPLFVLTSSAQL